MTAPANKIMTFSGDDTPVEPVVGHAVLALRGITTALVSLVEEGWYSLDEALEFVEPIMNSNARRLFQLDKKERILSKLPWLRVKIS